MLQRFILKLIGKVVRRPVLRHVAAFDVASQHCEAVQRSLWRRIIDGQADTTFGRDHGFRDIHTLSDFRRQLPIAGYERMEPYIARMRRGEITALVANQHVRMFALTSGTTAARKFIPVTDQYLADYRRGWNIWGMRTFRDHQEIKLRPIVQMSSDWREFETESGIPCGNVTGLTAEMQKRLIRFLYCVPACTSRITDTAAKYYTVLRLSLPRSVGMVVAANPSTLINLARAGNQEKESLIRDISDGALSTRFEVPIEIRRQLARSLSRPNRQRARELEAIVGRTGTLYPKDYWTQFLCGNWTGGSMGAYLRHFPKYYGDAPIRDVGLIASEGRMTIPIADGTPGGVLDITSHFFEFVPAAEMDGPAPTVLMAHELRQGEDYYILPTTSFGLYRYDIHDLVRVVGCHHRTPIVEFLSKGSHFANLTGEKLSEYHVTQAMERTLSKLDMALTSYAVAPCWHDELPYYGLFVEQGDLPNHQAAVKLANELESHLVKLNIEYAGKRDTLRLGPMRVMLLPDGAWNRWDRQRLAKTGGTAEQYKHPCLIGDVSFRSSMTVIEEINATGKMATSHR